MLCRSTKGLASAGCAAELYRHKGQLLLRQGHPDRAEKHYLTALSSARKQGAKLWELRAATSLARLCHEQKRAADAHDILAPVYDWFTEGFDTPDLKEAKAILEDLLKPTEWAKLSRNHP